MSKYDGIAKANVVVDSVKKDKPQVKTRGYFFSLFIRIVCAGAIVALLFGGRNSVTAKLPSISRPTGKKSELENPRFDIRLYSCAVNDVFRLFRAVCILLYRCSSARTCPRPMRF